MLCITMQAKPEQKTYEYFDDEEWINEFALTGKTHDPLGRKISGYKCKFCGSIQVSPTGSAFPLMKHLIKNHNIQFTKAGVKVE